MRCTEACALRCGRVPRLYLWRLFWGPPYPVNLCKPAGGVIHLGEIEKVKKRKEPPILGTIHTTSFYNSINDGFYGFDQDCVLMKAPMTIFHSMIRGNVKATYCRKKAGQFPIVILEHKLLYSDKNDATTILTEK